MLMSLNPSVRSGWGTGVVSHERQEVLTTLNPSVHSGWGKGGERQLNGNKNNKGSGWGTIYITYVKKEGNHFLKEGNHVLKEGNYVLKEGNHENGFEFLVTALRSLVVQDNL